MAKLDRKLQKIFASEAGNDGKTTFGSIAQGGEAVFSNDVEQLQTEAYNTGWRGAIKEVAGKGKAPILTDMNTINYITSYQLKYLFQNGIAEYKADETYYVGSKVKVVNNGVYEEYVSKIDDNINHEPTNSPTQWKQWVSGTPNWKNNVPYSIGDKVKITNDTGTKEYFSLINNNLNNNPQDINSNAWSPVVCPQWKSSMNYMSNDLVIRNDWIYRSKIDNNKGNDPLGDRTNWQQINKNMPTFQSSKSYMINDEVCVSPSGIYTTFRSVADNNLGNTPSIGTYNDGFWQRVTPCTLRVWNSGTEYCINDFVVHTIDGVRYLYMSLKNNNLGNTPPNSFDPDTNWARLGSKASLSNFTNVIEVGSASSYTAPDDGVFFVDVDTGEDGWNSINVLINGRAVIRWGKNGYINSQFAGNVYVKKGSVITMSWTGLDSLHAYFAYLN